MCIENPFFEYKTEQKLIRLEVWGACVFFDIEFQCKYFFCLFSMLSTDYSRLTALISKCSKWVQLIGTSLHRYLVVVAFYQFNFCAQLIQYHPIASKWELFSVFEWKKKPILRPNCCPAFFFQFECVRHIDQQNVKTPVSGSPSISRLWYAFEWSSVLEIKSKLPDSFVCYFFSPPDRFSK